MAQLLRSAIAFLLLSLMISDGGPALAGPGVTYPRYTIIDLGTLGGSSSVALGVNDYGQVAGGADTPEGLRHAYLWTDGQMIDLGTLPPTPWSEAWDVNDLAQVVGASSDQKAFFWEDGVMIDLLDSPAVVSAWGINDAGQVAGWFTTDATRAFIWKDGVFTLIPSTIGGLGSSAWDISNTGWVTGSANTGTVRHTFAWRDGIMTDLGTLGGGWSTGYAVNDLGQVAGASQRVPGELVYHACLWRNGEVTDLGQLGGFQTSRAWGINNRGQVTGIPGFLYDPDRGIQPLGELIPSDSGWFELYGRDINDAGQIVGSGIFNGRARAFLMTPVTDTDGDGVPDPWDECPGVDDAVFAPGCENAIPTVSHWGLTIMVLLLLVHSKVRLRGVTRTLR